MSNTIGSTGFASLVAKNSFAVTSEKKPARNAEASSSVREPKDSVTLSGMSHGKNRSDNNGNTVEDIYSERRTERLQGHNNKLKLTDKTEGVYTLDGDSNKADVSGQESRLRVHGDRNEIHQVGNRGDVAVVGDNSNDNKVYHSGEGGTILVDGSNNNVNQFPYDGSSDKKEDQWGGNIVVRGDGTTVYTNGNPHVTSEGNRNTVTVEDSPTGNPEMRTVVDQKGDNQRVYTDGLRNDVHQEGKGNSDSVIGDINRTTNKGEGNTTTVRGDGNEVDNQGRNNQITVTGGGNDVEVRENTSNMKVDVRGDGYNVTVKNGEVTAYDRQGEPVETHNNKDGTVVVGKQTWGEWLFG